MAWGRVNHRVIFIFGWTVPLKVIFWWTVPLKVIYKMLIVTKTIRELDLSPNQGFMRSDVSGQSLQWRRFMGLELKSTCTHTSAANEITAMHKTRSLWSFRKLINTANWSCFTIQYKEGKWQSTFNFPPAVLTPVMNAEIRTGLTDVCFSCVLAPPAGEMGVKMLQCFPFYRRCKERCKRQCPPETGEIFLTLKTV